MNNTITKEQSKYLIYTDEQKEKRKEYAKKYREARPSYFKQLQQTTFFNKYLDPNDNTKCIYENKQYTKLGLYLHLFRELKIYSRDDFVF
jgi:hypothetical protein